MAGPPRQRWKDRLLDLPVLGIIARDTRDLMDEVRFRQLKAVDTRYGFPLQGDSRERDEAATVPEAARFDVNEK